MTRFKTNLNKPICNITFFNSCYFHYMKTILLPYYICNDNYFLRCKSFYVEGHRSQWQNRKRRRKLKWKKEDGELCEYESIQDKKTLIGMLNDEDPMQLDGPVLQSE